MKKILTSVSIVMVVLMLLTVTASAFTASVLDTPDYILENGFKYLEKTTTENGKTQNIFYGEYNPTAEDAEYEWVLHTIKDENGTVLTNVLDIAKDYEKTTGRKVMLAVNGDYFAGGEPVDSYVNDGVVVKIGNMANKNSFGFSNTGIATVGRMTEVEVNVITYDADGNRAFNKVDVFNNQPEKGQIAIYNQPGTYTVANAGAMILRTDVANLTQYPLDCTEATMTSKGVQESKNFTLKSGQVAVVYTDAHNDLFANIKYGERVDVVNVPAGDFAGCDWVIGGYDAIVDNFEVKTNCHDDNGGNAAAPRTFIGMKEDGTIFVCVVDGRGAGGSVGLTVEEEAQLAGALGAQYALELDGGGSSTMIVRINDELTLRNVPSDGSMRRVANVVLLVEKPKAEENPGEDGPGEDGPGTEPGGDNPGVENPGGEKPSTNPIIAFFQSIIDAIIKFFTELFS